MEEIKVNVKATVNGRDLEKYMNDVNELIQALEKAKSLVNELTDDMASIKFEIVKE